MALLRRNGLHSVVFIDGIFLMMQSREKLIQVLQGLLHLLQLLSFLINSEIVFLGFYGEFTSDDLQSPNGEVAEYHCGLQEMVSVRDLARVMGRMMAAILAVMPAPICYRNLQWLKNVAFKSTQSFETRLQLDSYANKELLWWLMEVSQWNGRPIISSA